MYRSLVQCDINFGQTKEEEMKLIDFVVWYSAILTLVRQKKKR